jgi:hypothetical protein
VLWAQATFKKAGTASEGAGGGDAMATRRGSKHTMFAIARIRSFFSDRFTDCNKGRMIKKSEEKERTGTSL